MCLEDTAPMSQSPWQYPCFHSIRVSVLCEDHTGPPWSSRAECEEWARWDICSIQHCTGIKTFPFLYSSVPVVAKESMFTPLTSIYHTVMWLPGYMSGFPHRLIVASLPDLRWVSINIFFFFCHCIVLCFQSRDFFLTPQRTMSSI